MHDQIDIEHEDHAPEARAASDAAQPGAPSGGLPAGPVHEAPPGGPVSSPAQAEAALPSETERGDDQARALAEAQAKAAAAEERAAQAEDRWLRSQAELDNVRKRTARELADGLRYANERLVKELLPVLDNLERALAASAGDPGSAAALRDGVSLTLNQFLGALKKFGVEPVEALGRPFDPAVHEAIQQVESDQPAGTVVAAYQRGYLLNGRLLRPAMVGVAAPRPDGS